MTSLAQSHDAYDPSLHDRLAAVHQRDMPAGLAAQRRPRTAEPPGNPHGRFIAECDYDEAPPVRQAKRRPTRLVERHRKGFWGWLSTALFYGWHLLCVLWVGILFIAGAAGPFLLTVAFFTWLAGTLPLAHLRYNTRGRSIVTVVEG